MKQKPYKPPSTTLLSQMASGVQENTFRGYNAQTATCLASGVISPNYAQKNKLLEARIAVLHGWLVVLFRREDKSKLDWDVRVFGYDTLLHTIAVTGMFLKHPDFHERTIDIPSEIPLPVSGRIEEERSVSECVAKYTALSDRYGSPVFPLLN